MYKFVHVQKNNNDKVEKKVVIISKKQTWPELFEDFCSFLKACEFAIDFDDLGSLHEYLNNNEED